MATQMKAIVPSGPGAPSVLSLVDLPVPALESPYDILIKIHGASLNPADTKVRKSNTRPNRILGWDATGVVEAVGDSALFKKGDEVMYAGAIGRAGSNAQYGVVDSRIVGRKPKGWSWADAAGLPLVALTAWEMLEDQFHLKPYAVPEKEETLLIINGAGGVGTMATQLASKVFNIKSIIATASRPETIDWVKKNGATHVISHREDLGTQLKALNLTPSLVFICYDTLAYLPQLAPVMRPFGHVGTIVETDDPLPFHNNGAMGKALSFHWEFMFARPMHGYDLETQGRILNEVAKLAEEGKITSLTTVKEVLSVQSLRTAHDTVDNGKAIGKIVFELLSDCLGPVPLIEPNTLVLPPEPFEVLSRQLKLRELPCYEEKWNLAGAEAASRIRNALTIRKNSKPPSVTCWSTDDGYDYFTSIYRPMSPILTRRAMRQTPKLGQLTTDDSKLPENNTDMLKKHAIKPIDNSPMEEPHIKMEEVLRLKPTLDADMHASIKMMIRAVPSISGPRAGNKDYLNTAADQFLRSSSPPPMLHLAEEFVPLFPRSRHPRASTSTKDEKKTAPLGLGSMADLPAVIPRVEAKEEPEEDLFRQHMKVIDGWNAYVHSPSPSLGTPSLDDNTSEVDELFMPSPEKETPIQELFSARMYEVEIPRSKKPGGAKVKPKPLGAGQSLHSFLGPLLTTPAPMTGAEPRIVTTPKSQPSSPRTTITASMLGQPPYSTIEEGDVGSIRERLPLSDDTDATGDDFDQAIGKLYNEVKGLDPDAVIMKVRLDERECHLMDVPKLPSPTEHEPNGFMPTSLRSLVAPQARDKNDAAGNSDEAIGDLAFLKKATGNKSLTLELTWRPFNFGRKKPTHEELARVESDINDTALTELDRASGDAAAIEEKVKQVLQFGDVAETEDNKSWESMAHGSPPQAVTLASNCAGDGFSVIMTRKDRLNAERLRRGEDLVLSGRQEQKEDEDDEDRNSIDEEREVEEALRPAKKPRLGSPDDTLVKAHERRNSEVALDEQLWTNGSGVIFMDQDHEFEEIEYLNSQAPVDAGYDEPRRSQQGTTGSYQYCDTARHQEPAEHDQDGLLAIPALYPGLQHDVPPPLEESTALPYRPADDRADDAPLPNMGPERALPSDPLKSGSDLASSTTLRGDAAEHRSLSIAWEGRSARQNLVEFMRLRSKQVPTVEVEQRSLSPEQREEPARPEEVATTPACVPPELIDRTTLVVPVDWPRPTTVHRYLASLDLIQKRGLVRHLQSDLCAVDLVERDTLGDADVILDPETCIVFVSLPALPAQCEATVQRLGALSWRYRDVLVVFEAFPASRAYGSTSRLNTSCFDLNVFSAPVIKAVGKLRRDLRIAEACEKRRPGSGVHSAFALNVEDAAVFARVFGDMAEAVDATRGAVWGDRAWLDVEAEGQYDLAANEGMNPFCAALVLSQVTLDDFLEAEPEQRMQYFGPLVGEERITQFNEGIARRWQAMDQGIPSDPPTDLGPTTSELLYASDNFEYTHLQTAPP
ncbi:hypothetical protein OE88DRAFT_1730282 [Heliocybe sulcata]|uniref:Enoyl reductase (ER) domain-containing protein n=1 Tax=Heliocybe sulcata TaxID=5364 RepID=A0A5C3NG13_9AGAM|nr:hypothetical protein OE88DRAFT_1730282 [Heliocybe sulcata]